MKGAKGKEVKLKDGRIGVVGDLIKHQRKNGGWTYLISVPVGTAPDGWESHMLKRDDFTYTGSVFDYHECHARLAQERKET